MSDPVPIDGISRSPPGSPAPAGTGLPRVPLSVCIITRNEEKNLLDCLDSVSFADEIIVVDSHSTDGTREIAGAFRCRTIEGREVVPRVIERDWPGHVEQKNFAIQQASNDWVLCIDADERISPELRREILETLGSGAPDSDGYAMPRRTFYLGRWVFRGGWYPDRKVRLFRRSRGQWGGTNPHDHVRLEGKVRNLRGDMYHYSYRCIADHVRTINFFTDIAAAEKDKKGIKFPLLRMLVQPPFKFFKSYVLKQGFREGTVGFIVAFMGMYYVFLKYAKLYELTVDENRRAAARGPGPAKDAT